MGPWEPDRLNVFLIHDDGVDVTQYRVVLAITGDDPAAEAERLVDQLTAGDPRPWGEVCGGWPSPGRP